MSPVLNPFHVRTSAWSCPVAIVTCMLGCGNPMTGSLEEANQEITFQSADSSESSKQEEQTPSSRVEPGTILTEANFKKTLGDTGAKYVVVQVYLEGCGPCMTEALHLTEQEPQWRKEGVAILGLGMDQTPDGPKAFYEHTGKRITYPLYLAPWFAQQQEVLMTPTVFIYSAGGEQLFRTDPEQAEEGIMAALSEKLTDFSNQLAK